MTPAGIGLWALVALAQTASSVSVPVRIEFDAPPGCPDADAFLAGVLARARRVHRARSGETAVRLTVHVTRAGGQVHGELRLNEAGGEADTREVDGATCAEVVQVLSLTAALAIDPSAALLPSGVPEKPAAAPSAVRAAPAVEAARSPAPPVRPSSRAAPSAPAPSVGAPASAPPTRPPAEVPASVVPPPVMVTPASAAAVVAAPSPEPARARGASVGASLVAARVLSSSLSLGGSLWARLTTTTRDGWTPSLALALLYLRGDLFESGDDLGTGWMAGGATACPGWALGHRVRLEPCARVIGGVLSVTDHSVNMPRSVDRWWGGVGALLHLTAPLGHGLMLELGAGVDVPFVTRRFIITTVANQPVGETTSLIPTLSLGLSHGL